MTENRIRKKTEIIKWGNKVTKLYDPKCLKTKYVYIEK